MSSGRAALEACQRWQRDVHITDGAREPVVEHCSRGCAVVQEQALVSFRRLPVFAKRKQQRPRAAGEARNIEWQRIGLADVRVALIARAGFRRLSASSRPSLEAEALAPMAQVRTLMWELVLEDLFPGEVLEIRAVDSALANASVREAIDVLEQVQPDDNACLDPRADGADPGPTLVAIERCDLSIDSIPVDLVCKVHQFMLQVEDLVRRPSTNEAARTLVISSHRVTFRHANKMASSCTGNWRTAQFVQLEDRARRGILV